MRSNSGKDESRDNLHDPTGRGNAASAENKPKAPADHRTERKD